MLSSCSNKSNSASDKQEIIGQTAEKLTSPDISFLDVNAFSQDSLGYMWLATLGGLNRYNGYEFQYYMHDHTDSTSIDNDFVFSLLVDTHHKLWIGTSKGVNRYNYQTNQFERYAGQATPIYSFYEDVSGKIWMATPNGPGLIDTLNKKLNFQWPEQFVNLFWEDASKHLWMGLNESKGLAVRKTETQWEYFALPGNRWVTCMYPDPQGIWWLGTNTGIELFDPTSRTFIDITIPALKNKTLNKTQINFIKEIEPLKLLIGTTTEGFFYYDILTQTLQHNQPARLNPNNSAQLHSCYIDKQCNVWIGTYDKGFVVGNKQSDYFNADHQLSSAFKGKFVTRIKQDAYKNLWIGTRYDGLYRYSHSAELKRINNLNLLPDKHEFLESLFIDSKQRIWIGFESQMVVGEIKNSADITINNCINLDNVREIKEDKNGNIWIGTWYGLFKAIIVGKDIKFEKIYSGNIPEIVVLDSGELLFSAFGIGVFSIKENSKTPTQLTLPEGFADITSACITMFEDSQRRLWFGSYGSGSMMSDNEHYKRFSVANGMPNNNALCFQEDMNGEIWMSTSHGLSKVKINDRDTIITNYFRKDGIQGDQYHEKAGHCGSDGRIFFSGNHGLTFFNPSSIVPNSNPPRINIEDLKIFNQSVKPAPYGSVLTKSITFTDRIVLNHNQTTISLDYSGIDFYTSNKLTYKYKLSGFDEQWNYVGNFRRATYSNLPPGKYTFYVTATNGDEVESAFPATLQITVKSAPWFSWQAWLLYGILLTGIVFTIFKMLIRAKMKQKLIEIVRNESEREHEVSQMKINFFANISHEVRTPLTLISAPLEKLFSSQTINGDDLKLLNIINRNVQRMLQLINELLDFTKIESGALSINLHQIDIMQELHYIYEAFVYLAERKKINLLFKPHTDNLKLWIDTDKIEKILYNLLSNALKHTPEAGTIDVSTRMLTLSDVKAKYNGKLPDDCDSYMEIVVSDTGLGVPEDKIDDLFVRYRQISGASGMKLDYSGSGIGLHYTKCLVESHNGQICARIRPERGMEFSFILPCQEIYTESESEEVSKEAPQRKRRPKPVELDNELPKKNNAYTILVAEDNIELMDFMINMLSKEYNIIEALDGDKAWEQVQSLSPDLILSDVIMPGLSGYQLCEQVKQYSEYCHIPVVMLTAKTSMFDQIEGLEHGADAYVCKPFNVDYLLLTIKNLLKHREILGRYFSTPKTKEHTPIPVTLNQYDQSFMDKLTSLLEKELSNPNLNIDYIAIYLGFSRTAFYRKIKGLTNSSPIDFLQNYRLKRAAEKIIEGSVSLIEISEQTGFSSYSYFSKSFKKHFGQSPKDYSTNQCTADEVEP